MDTPREQPGEPVSLLSRLFLTASRDSELQTKSIGKSAHEKRWIRKIETINQSINQSKGRRQVIQSTNQPINRSTNQPINQSINLSVPWHFKCTQSINRLTLISKSVFSLNRRGLQILIVFCTVLDDEESNGTMRWGRGCEEGGEIKSGTGCWYKDVEWKLTFTNNIEKNGKEWRKKWEKNGEKRKKLGKKWGKNGKNWEKMENEKRNMKKSVSYSDCFEIRKSAFRPEAWRQRGVASRVPIRATPSDPKEQWQK